LLVRVERYTIGPNKLEQMVSNPPLRAVGKVLLGMVFFLVFRLAGDFYSLRVGG